MNAFQFLPLTGSDPKAKPRRTLDLMRRGRGLHLVESCDHAVKLPMRLGDRDMAGKIFINYRRGDDPGFTQALYQRLEEEFTAGDLFMDVEGHIKPGDDFVAVLNSQVLATDVLLAVVGPRWSELLAARANDPDDFVAIEITAALENNKRVIPVLVGGAGMPRADALPEAIKPLARRNAVGLRPDRFKADCQGLITALKEQLAAAVAERAARTETERAAAEAARLEAEGHATARARAAEERSRAQAAAGLSTEEIRKAEELANWEFVKDRNDVQDLRDHLARFPSGTTERYALSKLDQLVWRALGSAPDITQLRAYLDEFPKGANAAEAQTLVSALEKESAEQRAAEQRHLQETAQWGAVAASTDKGAIEEFLRAWPDGQHAASARKRIAELRGSVGGLRRGILLGAGMLLPALAVAAIWIFFMQMRGWTPPEGSEADTWAYFQLFLLAYFVFQMIVMIPRILARDSGNLWSYTLISLLPFLMILYVLMLHWNNLERLPIVQAQLANSTAIMLGVVLLISLDFLRGARGDEGSTR
jgi:hypothetical protein